MDGERLLSGSGRVSVAANHAVDGIAIVDDLAGAGCAVAPGNGHGLVGLAKGRGGRAVHKRAERDLGQRQVREPVHRRGVQQLQWRIGDVDERVGDDLAAAPVGDGYLEVIGAFFVGMKKT